MKDWTQEVSLTPGFQSRHGLQLFPSGQAFPLFPALCYCGGAEPFFGSLTSWTTWNIPVSQEEKEKRRLEQLERKKELQRLLEEEDSKLKGKSPKPLTPGKVTRAQIEETLRRDQQQKENEDTVDKPKSHLEVPLEENVNRRVPEEGSVEARTIEDAIAVLSVSEDSDRHPERRMKAAFTAFEELHLPRLKKENPNMRLSQLKQLLKKEWMRSPDNPMNQRTMAYNAQK
ncbi:coiled-coil domain-containing protein 124-like isoform 1-T1 [Sarcophilus harrisii]